MTHLFTLDDWPNLHQTLAQAALFKKDPLKAAQLGRGKTLGLVFKS